MDALAKALAVGAKFVVAAGAERPAYPRRLNLFPIWIWRAWLGRMASLYSRFPRQMAGSLNVTKNGASSRDISDVKARHAGNPEVASVPPAWREAGRSSTFLRNSPGSALAIAQFCSESAFRLT